MTGVRAWIARHRGLAMWLVALALLSKALVPAGYMPGHDASRTIDVVLCSDPGGQALAQQIVIPFEKGSEDVPAKHGGKGECAFTALAHGAVAAADPAFLLAAIAFLFALGFAPMVALWLSSSFGLIAAGGYLLSGAVGTLVALWLNRELARTIG